MRGSGAAVNERDLTRPKMIFIWLLVLFSSSLGLCFVGSVHEIAETFHVSLSVAGQVVSIYTLSFAFLGPLFIKKYGRLKYKKAILYALVLLLISNVLIQFASSILLFFIVRVLSAGLVSYLITKCFGYVTECSSGKTLGKNLSLLYTSFAAANTFIIPLFSYISNHYGWMMITNVLIVGFMVFALLVQFLVKLEGREKNQTDKIKNETSREIKQKNVVWYKNRHIVKLLLMTICVLGSNMMVMSYISPYLLYFGNTSNSISVILFIFGVGGIVGSYTSSKLTNRFSEYKSMRFILTAYALLFSLIYFVQNIYAFGVVIFAWSATQWSSGPLIQKMLVNYAQDSREAEVLLNLNMSFINIGMSLGVIIGGLVIEFSMKVLPLAGMVIALGALLIHLFSVKTHHFKE